jgi:hypothetical protein
MAARRYRTEIAGLVRVGLEFDSEAELEAFLAGRDCSPWPSSGAAPSAPADQGGAKTFRGRPSLDAKIAKAVEELGDGIDSASTLAERARKVLRHLAPHTAAQDMPSTRTVERFLADHPLRQKSRQKLRQKSTRARLASCSTKS